MTKSGLKWQENSLHTAGTVEFRKDLTPTISSEERLRLRDWMLQTPSYSAPHIMYSITSSPPTKPQRNLKGGIKVNLGDITLILKNKPKNTALNSKQ